MLALAAGLTVIGVIGLATDPAQADGQPVFEVRVVDEQEQPIPDVAAFLERVDQPVAAPEDVQEPTLIANGTTDASGLALLESRDPAVDAGQYRIRLFDLPDDLQDSYLVDLTADGEWRSDELRIEPSGVLVLPVVRSNLEVVLDSAEGAPADLGFLTVEERAAGGGPGDWRATEQLSDRFGRSVQHVFPAEKGSNRALARVDPPADTSREFRVLAHPSDGPPLRQPFTIAADGVLSFGPSPDRHAMHERRVTLRTPPTAPATADPEWLEYLNRARAQAALPAVEQRGDWNEAAELHARYATRNRWFAHDEDPSLPGHTLAGRWATQVGNLFRANVPMSERGTIQGWLNSPGHAGWILDPRVRYAGYGTNFQRGQGDHSFNATLPMASGLLLGADVPERTRFPGDGAVVGAPTPSRPGDCNIVLQQGTSSFLLEEAVCTLHLFARDAYEANESVDLGRYRAQVRVDGSAVGHRLETTFHQGHIAIRLDTPLLPGQDVSVSLSRDGQAFDAWSFETVAQGQEPEPTPVPPFEAGTDADGEAEPPQMPGEEPGSGAGDDIGDPPADDADGPPADDGTEAPDTSMPGDIAGTTHEAAILRVLEEGIASGYGDGSFGPGDAVTRDQMATFLSRALGLEASGPQPFADVAEGSTHDVAVRALVEAGITGGCSEDAYCPSDEVTRDQMASFLSRALGLEASGPQPFSDVGEGSTHDVAVRALVEAGVTSGCGDDRYCPRGPVTRGQMATFLVRALDL